MQINNKKILKKNDLYIYSYTIYKTYASVYYVYNYMYNNTDFRFSCVMLYIVIDSNIYIHAY